MGDNEEEAALIDATHEQIKDALALLLGVLYGPGIDKRIDALKTRLLEGDELFAVLNPIEECAAKNGAGFIVGQKRSIADLYLAGVILVCKAVLNNSTKKNLH
eukprot:GABV01005911.1.p1 GENE.GABV01005911.1~~GABV01005911.1.p1  ORF type:complete len:103 (-),score=46.54 GABV01005911.1:11-319(-)